MNIRRKIVFIVVILLLFLVLFGGLASYYFKEYADSTEQSGIAGQMVVAALNRRLSANDYLLHPGERAETQWRAGQGQLLRLSQINVHLDTPAEKELIRKIQNNLISANSVFDQLVLTANDTSDAALYQEKAGQLMEELTLKAQETARLSSEMGQFNENEAVVYLRHIFILFASLASIFLILLLGSFWVIWQGVASLDLAKTRAQRGEDRLNILLQSIGDGVFVIDRSWNITLWNKAASDLTGWTAEEALGKPLRDVVKLLNGDTSKENIVFIEEAMLYGQTKSMENHTVLVRKDGREIPVGDSAAPIFDGDQVSGCIVVFRDMSKEYEAQKLKEDFTFRIVHDLRSPLTVMKSVLADDNMTLKCGGDPELKEGYDLLGEATKQMLGMVDDLLASVQSQKTGPSVKKVAVTEVIADVARTLKPLASSKGISCEYVPPKGLPTVAVPNLDHIREIFTNLFTNAIKYNKDGGSILVSHEVVGAYLKTDVGDTGVGVSEENLKKLFAPYSRVNEKEGIEGTGLGLYIVKKLAEEAKGKIEVSSKENVGTVFSVYLPIGN